ncbi:phosphodiesterase [Mycobacterium angelicum]|uniref:Phosphodiesterase n=1 Tax=Mycobacterium angelicum TaxID=470074 RepID=A0A1X0A333_MYCAN|nr:phosphodiesterase [Mycobacterium angelicum]MCV7197303.1 phosphodiesterase [Mycobacterium angelicum]ORA24268.1 phosphodiesterase [Mycobacterium angelicum]
MNVSNLVTLPFQWGAAIRGKRFFHPLGVLAQGSIERVAPYYQGLPVPTSDVVARLSKAVGTPGPIPDAMGLALRVPGLDHATKPWDMLLVSAASGAIGRVLALRPVGSWTSQTMTTLMPLQYHGKRWWLRARITTPVDGPGLSLAAVRDRIEDGGIEMEIDQACGTGHFEPLAHVKLTKVASPGLDDDVSFDPVLNTPPGVSLYPDWLAGLRKRAYAQSRDGRDQR